MGNFFPSTTTVDSNQQTGTLLNEIQGRSPEFYRFSTAFGTNKQRELLINGYIHNYVFSVYPMEIIETINLYYFNNTMYQFYRPLIKSECPIPSFYSKYELSESDTLIKGKGMMVKNVNTEIFSRALYWFDRKETHYWSINILSTPYNCFDYIGISRKISSYHTYEEHDFNPNKYSYRYYPDQDDWKLNQIFTVKLDLTNHNVTFYAGNKIKKSIVVKSKKKYFFVINMNDSKSINMIISKLF